MPQCRPINWTRTVGSRTFKKTYAALQAAGAKERGSYAKASRRAAKLAKQAAVKRGAKPTKRDCRTKGNRGKK
jgi:hypothetical protein